MFVGSHCAQVHHHLHLLRTLWGCLWSTPAPLLIVVERRLSTITGLDYWAGLVDRTCGLTLKIIFTPDETRLSVELRLWKLCSLLSSYVVLGQITHSPSSPLHKLAIA